MDGNLTGFGKVLWVVFIAGSAAGAILAGLALGVWLSADAIGDIVGGLLGNG